MSEPVVCATCGTPAPDVESERFAWSLAVERGRSVWTCPRCARDNLRSIEAKLEQDWW